MSDQVMNDMWSGSERIDAPPPVFRSIANSPESRRPVSSQPYNRAHPLPQPIGKQPEDQWHKNCLIVDCTGCTLPASAGGGPRRSGMERFFEVNSPAVVSEIIDCEAVIMNLRSGNYYST